MAAIGITLLMLLMVCSGIALIVNRVAPVRSVMMRYSRGAQALRILDVIAIIVFVPGTITLYSVYVRKLWQLSATL